MANIQSRTFTLQLRESGASRTKTFEVKIGRDMRSRKPVDPAVCIQNAHIWRQEQAERKKRSQEGRARAGLRPLLQVCSKTVDTRVFRSALSDLEMQRRTAAVRQAL